MTVKLRLLKVADDALGPQSGRTILLRCRHHHHPSSLCCKAATEIMFRNAEQLHDDTALVFDLRTGAGEFHFEQIISRKGR